MPEDWQPQAPGRRSGTMRSARPSATLLLVPAVLIAVLTYRAGVVGLILGLAAAAFIYAVLFRQGVALDGDTLTYRGILRTRKVRLRDVKEALLVQVVHRTHRDRSIVIRGHDLHVLLRVVDSVANPQSFAIAQLLHAAGKPVTSLGPVKASELERAIPGASGWMEDRGLVRVVSVAVFLGLFAAAVVWTFLPVWVA